MHDVDPQRLITLTLKLRAPKLPGVNELPARPLSPAEFSDRYGASPSDVQLAEKTLSSFGLKVDVILNGGRSMQVSGPASAVEAAFRPNIGIYHTARQGEYLGREGTIQVPSQLNGVVTAVLGLDQRQMANRKSIQRKAAAKQVKTIGPLTASDLEQRYNFPPGSASGQTVAIAEFAVPDENNQMVPPTYFPEEVTAFCRQEGRATPNIKIVPVNVAPLTEAQLKALDPSQQQLSADLSGEVMMDIEIVAALCPGADVVVYFASFDEKGWVDLLDQVAQGSPSVPVSLSISWGSPEDSSDWSEGGISAISEGLQAAAMLGITICVSSGDDGSGDGSSAPGAHVDFPAVSPFVLAVGGTMLNGKDEVVWWEAPGRRTGKGGGAGGGGVSTRFPRPSWQTVKINSLNAGGIDGRVIPDVSALAGPPFYSLILPGGMRWNGGTSASAPLWAALIARMAGALPASKRQRFLTPLLYGPGANGNPLGQGGCRDILVGQNASHPLPGKGYAAIAGFDAASGWGVPDGQKLLRSLSSI
ncbi:protease pro-enzyme activation domain-containing protein [Mesorhizobium sp. CU2]|uniref:S53 family peptidase n=1 Tax=Mesorhizobium sp. CU2 TaxID=2589985 RepID=UPI0015E41161|nr:MULTISPECIES: S53 family peptidase [unclassified Mesorhizobium]